MALGIGNNLGMLNAARGTNEIQRTLADTLKKLASGKRINSAADDPAGLVITEKMDARLVSLSAAVSNNEMSANMIRTAESSMGQVSNLLLKARSLVVDSANTGVNDASMRKANQSQLNEILTSIDRITGNAQYGSKKLLDGNLTVTPMISGDGATTSVKVDRMGTQDLGQGAKYDAAMNGQQAVTSFSSLADLKGGTDGGGVLATGTQDSLAQALGVIDRAIGDTATARGKLGALEADFIEPATDSFRSAYQNLQESEASIADTDMALESSRVTQENIKSQVHMALLAQGKTNAQTLLQLLM